MGRGKRLSKEEINTILVLKKENYSISKIASIIKRSRKVIYNLLQNVQSYGRKKSTGRPPALTIREKRAILRAASNSCLTARQIAHEKGIQTNIRNVRRVIQTCEHLQRKKIKRKPPLTKHHKIARLTFAKEHIQWKKRWQHIIFSDEKRFNLDGPDGFDYYFHDVRKEQLSKVRRQMGGGSTMIWAGIGYNGRTDIKFIDHRMNAVMYKKLIEEQIKKHATHIAGPNFTFQQDNASVHTAAVVKTFFASENISVLTWPAKSPDLNIIENCWGELSRAVYVNNNQFNTIEELKECIRREWDRLPQEKIKNLYKSLPNRMIEVIQNQGGSTHY